MLPKLRVIEGLGFSSNVYVLGDQSITLVDTGVGDNRNRVIPRLRASELDIRNVLQVIITHAHIDHIGGLREILGCISPKVMIHGYDLLPLKNFCDEASVLKDGDIIETEIGRLKVIHTPGHTNGSVCLYEPTRRILFSGDTVFAGGFFGRTDLGGDDRTMVDSLEKLTKLEVDVLLPGHGPIVEREAFKHVKLALEQAKTILI